MRSTATISKKNNFFLYVFSIMSIGILLIGAVASGAGIFMVSLLQSGSLSIIAFRIVMIVCLFASMLTDYIFEYNIKSSSLSTSMCLYGLSAFITGIFLSPVYIIASYGYLDIVISAFIGTISLFIALGLLAYFSKKDFTSLGSILFAGAIALLIASIANLALSFFIPAISSIMGVGISFFSILLSSGFILFNLSNLSKFYDSNIGNVVALSRIGLLGAHLLLRLFVSIFISIINILLFASKKRKND